MRPHISGVWASPVTARRVPTVAHLLAALAEQQVVDRLKIHLKEIGSTLRDEFQRAHASPGCQGRRSPKDTSPHALSLL